MKKFSKFSGVLLLLLAGIGCQKEDLSLTYNGSEDVALSKQAARKSAAAFCDVVQVTSYHPYYNYWIGAYMFDTIVHTFSYYPWGGPKTITTSDPGTGNEEHAFEYDNKKRLTKHITFYREQSNWISYVKYVSDDNDLVTSDTVFVSWRSGVFGYNNYYYDDQQRLVRKDHTAPGLFSYSRTFSYDARGNLISAGMDYDDKVNIRRTNPYWMFLDENYSVNTGIYSAYQYNFTYNSKGLPVTIFGLQMEAHGYTPTLMGKRLNEVVYDCKGKPETVVR